MYFDKDAKSKNLIKTSQEKAFKMQPFSIFFLLTRKNAKTIAFSACNAY